VIAAEAAEVPAFFERAGLSPQSKREIGTFGLPAGRNATFPARTYSVNGERRGFALPRLLADTSAQERIRELVLQAYAEYEEQSREVT
jgi:hypothetical protein